ncbi:MAG: arsenate reductase ArsC [Cellvibrionaceae bacterium]
MKILFICTHNRCRSILAEAMTNHVGKGVIEAKSAGSQPAGKVHPLSLKYLAEKGLDTSTLQSQSWDEFEKDNFDVVITVCDSAAQEQCPLWIGNSLKVHWGLSDPSKIEGSEEKIIEAFNHTISVFEKRAKKMLSIDFSSISEQDLKTRLTEIAEEVR